jgi:hypothetical protein
MKTSPASGELKETMMHLGKESDDRNLIVMLMKSSIGTEVNQSVVGHAGHQGVDLIEALGLDCLSVGFVSACKSMSIWRQPFFVRHVGPDEHPKESARVKYHDPYKDCRESGTV